jgi:hypothetical protein
LDDGGGLAAWKATMTVQGLIIRRGLRARWEALMAEHVNPWYHTEESKAQAKTLVEECAMVGGADDRKDIGSSLHTLTALVDSGRAPSHLTEETEKDVAAYTDGLAAAGITVVPGCVEVTVVLDEHRVAGTFDRLVQVPGFALPLVADLKTGGSLDYSWQPFAVQMAAYAHADAIYRQGSKKDGSQDERLAMPEVDRHHGLILWLNAGTGVLELHIVDLDAGWEAFQHSLWARAWRGRRDLARPLEQVEVADQVDLVPALQASLEALGVAPEEPPAGYVTVLRGWLQDRINVAGRHQHARADLGSSWPHDLPTLRSSEAHTEDQYRAIEQILDGVEKRWEIAFPPPRPDPAAYVANIFTNTSKEKPA